MSKEFFNKTLIIGLGLIGGSFARSLRKYQVSKEIWACDIDHSSLELAISNKVIDGVANIQNNLNDFDFIVIATPIGSYFKIIKQISKKISDKAIIIDLGSLKDAVKKEIPQNMRHNFVLCHPIAGLEQSGFESSIDDLFLNKKFIICPENTDKNLVEKVKNVITTIGCDVMFLESKEHDKIYALVSHLPQFLSFLTKGFSPKEITDNFFKTAFRLDESSPEIWSDIFKFNQNNLEKYYLEFFDNLEKLQKNPLSAITIYNDLSDKKSKKANFDEKFFLDNFSNIMFRVFVVISYMQIKELKNLQNYSGSGFTDFTSIIEVLNYDQKNLQNLINKNQQKISKFFELISS